MNVFVLTLLCHLLLLGSTAPAQRKTVAAAKFSGTWEYKYNTLSIRALDEQRLQVEFSGVYPYRMADGRPVGSTGEGRGVAIIEGETAVFKPEETEEACRITIRFKRGRLTVRQEGTCGFGFNVMATGVYRKTKAR